MSGESEVIHSEKKQILKTTILIDRTSAALREMRQFSCNQFSLDRRQSFSDTMVHHCLTHTLPAAVINYISLQDKNASRFRSIKR